MKMFLRLKKAVILIMFALVSGSAFAENSYQGEWIWKADDNKPNTWMAFRKEVSLKDVDKNAIATIAVDSKYWLWINGELIVREGGIKRTPNPYDTYADTVAIGKHLKQGENSIAILVWYWGKAGHGHHSSGHGGLFFQMNTNKQVVKSDNSWKVLEHPGFDTSITGPQPYRPLSEFNIAFDARKDIEGWYNASFDDSKWKTAKTFGLPPTKPWGNLVIRQIPQWKDFGLKDYLTKYTKVSMGNILIMKLPYNAQITPYFKIKAKAGLLVSMQTDKYTDGGAYNVRAEYITKDGEQEYESPGWLSGDAVWYSFPAGVEILELKYRESGYNASFDGAFKSNDEFYNVLWEKSRRTLYVNMRDNFMDCPTRERAMWWGDVVHESLQSYYVFSKDVHNLTKKAIEELMAWQTSEGVIYSPIPGPHYPLPFGPHRELPLQSLAAISHLSLDNYYRFVGDTETLIKAYPAIKKYMSLWEMGKGGLVKHRDGKWSWQDWGENIDVPLLDNTWYYSALQSAKDIAKLAKQYADTVEYAKRMKSIKDNFDKVYWNGKAYQSPTHKSAHPDDRGNAMAIITGLADKNRWEQITEVLRTEYHASPYMEKFVNEALFVAGKDELALERMKNRHQEMVTASTTTLWEAWKPGFNQSLNHGWSGGPLSLMMQYVAGVNPLEPAFKIFSIKPQLGNLTEVSATVPTKFGKIVVDIKKNAETFNIILKKPTNTVAVVELPLDKYNGKDVYVNGEKVTSELLKSNKQIIETRKGDKRLFYVKAGDTWRLDVY